MQRFRNKILAYFLTLFIAMMVLLFLGLRYGLPFTGFKGLYESVRLEAFNHFSLVADLKKERLLHWLEERRDDARILAGNPMVASSVEKIISFLREKKRGADGENGGRKAVWNALRQEPFYVEVTSYLRLIVSAYEVYSEVDVVDGGTGRILLATNELNIGKKVFEPSVLRKKLNAATQEYLDIGDDDLRRRMSLRLFRLIRVPGLKSGERTFDTFILLHIHPRNIMTPLLHTASGLGVTGEALLFTGELRLITPLKHRLRNGRAAMPMKYRLRTVPARKAAGGEEGLLATEDYRGVPVLAAYRHIQINAETAWGMVVKQDQSEIFAHHRRAMIFFVVIGPFCLALLILFSFFIANSLSAPIRRLSGAAEQVEKGHFDVQLPTARRGEIGLLVKAFESMVLKIRDWHNELEKEVEQRTHLLDVANRELRREIFERRRAEKEKEILLREIHHRVKNNMQVISSLHGLQARYIKDEEDKRMFMETRNRVHTMGLVHDLLYRSKNFTDLDVGGYFNSLLNGLLSSYNMSPPKIALSLELDDVSLGLDALIPCGLIVNELVTNSLKHAFLQTENRAISVVLRKPDEVGLCTLLVSDNGCGLPPIEDLENSPTLGFQLVTSLVNQLQGEIEIDREAGTAFRIRFVAKVREVL